MELEFEFPEVKQHFCSLLKNSKLYSLLLDCSGNILVVNESLLRKTGWKIEQLLGRSWIEAVVAPEFHEKVKNILLLLTEEYLDSSNYFDVGILTNTGDRVCCTWIISPLKSSSGKIIGFTSLGESVLFGSNGVRLHKNSLGSNSGSLDKLLPQVMLGPETIGKYTLHKSLGKAVKLAVDNDTGQTTAIKLVSKMSLTEQELSRAKREIEILRKLTPLANPHIVKFIESFETDTQIVIVQEYLSGGELGEWLNKKQQCLSEITALHIFRQILSALHCCHKNNIIHRDIKLQNILMNEENNKIKLIDFGVGNFVQYGVFRNTFVGTPAFVAPEIVLGEKYQGPEVDIWSIGVVLYFMLNRDYPFPHIGAILKGKFKQPESVSKDCLDLLERMLTVEKEKRITLEEILNHPWVVKKEGEEEEEKDNNNNGSNNESKGSTAPFESLFKKRRTSTFEDELNVE